MDVGPSVYASFLRSTQSASHMVGPKRDEHIARWQSHQPDSASTSPPHSTAMTGVSSSPLATQTMSQLIHETQTIPEESAGEPLSFEEMFVQNNTWSDGDAKLLEAMTGYTVKDNWQFVDQAGNPGFPEDLTQHTMRSFMMELHGARKTGTLEGEGITVAEFTQLMRRAQASAVSMGEGINNEYLNKGLAYLNELEARTSA